MEKIKTLVSLSSFVPTLEYLSHSEYRRLTNNYHRFLNQNMQLGMFIPVSVNNTLVEKSMCNEGSMATSYYNECKSKVLFEGFEIKKDMHHQTKRTIIEGYGKRVGLILEFHSGEVKEHFEDGFIYELVKYKPILSETALKQIYG